MYTLEKADFPLQLLQKHRLTAGNSLNQEHMRKEMRKHLRFRSSGRLPTSELAPAQTANWQQQ